MGQLLRLFIFAALLLLPLTRGVWNEWMLSNNSVIVFLAIVLVGWFTYRVSKRNSNIVVQIVFVLILALIAQWGVLQFILQGDLGLHLIGESRLAVDEVGVAKFAGPGTDKLLRAYGPYLHANVFGGVMVIGLMVWARLVFTKTPGDRLRQTPGVSTAFVLMGFFILLGLILSFSRAAWLGGVMVGFITWLNHHARDGDGDPHPSLLPMQGEGIRYWRLLLILLITLLTLSPLIFARMFDVEDVAYQERVTAGQWSVSLLSNANIWRGVGPGNYIPALEKGLKEQGIPYQTWQLDYVHSVPLLLIAEWGLLVSLFVLLGLVWMLYRYLGARWYWFIPILPMLLLDHYFITQLGPAVVLGIGLVLVVNDG